MVQRTKPAPGSMGVPGGMLALTAQTLPFLTFTASALTTPRALSVLGGATVNFDGSAAAVLPSPVNFGTGAPSTLIGEGALYVNTTPTPYDLYVQHSGAWHLTS